MIVQAQRRIESAAERDTASVHPEGATERSTEVPASITREELEMLLQGPGGDEG